MKAYDIIKKPLMTEKISALNANQTYCFQVSPKATKIDIKRALKEMFGADVDEVRIANLPGKSRFRRNRKAQKKAAFRKAYITLRNKAKLDITKFAKEEKELKIKKIKDPKIPTTKAKSTKKIAKKTSKA